MRVHLVLTAAASLLKTACAVFADDAYHVDYHLALLGAPQEHTTFFHQPSLGSKASLLYTLSEKGVLGAVHPKDGSLVWRQQIAKNGNRTSSHLRAGAGQDILVSAVDGELAGWSALDGRQAWAIDLGKEPALDLEVLEVPEGKEGARSGDAIVLTDGQRPTLRRVDGKTGQVKWEFRDESGDTPYQVSASATEVYFISLHTTMLGGLKIRIVSIDPTNGRKTDQYSLNSEGDISSVADILSVGANSASPIIAWTDKSRSALKVNVIGSKNVASFDVGSGVEKIVLHAPYHIEARPHFLVHYETAKQHWAEVYHVDLKSSNVKKAYSLPKLAGQGAFSTSVSDANVYFTRVSEAEISVVASTSHGKLARRPTKGFAASPVHSVTEVSVKGDVVSAVRSAVYTSSGKWVLVRDGTLSWQRPEYLAGVTSAVWAYPQIEEALLQELEVESHRNVIAAYVHRVTRHLQDLEKLPGYLSSLPSKLTHSLGAGKTVETTAVVHDTFGYHKTVVCATETGRLVALDAGNSGQVIWNVQAVTLQPGQHWNSPQLVSKPDGTVLALNPSDNTWIGFNATSGAKFAATPNTAETETGFSYAFADGALVGSSAKQASAAPLWTFKPIGDEHILSVTSRPADDPVASIGKVLGDRRVLYKYLNPNLILVTSISETLKTATFHVLDAVTGSILASSSHTDVDTSLPISSTLSENWFAYSFATSSTTTTKGHQLVIGELYESALPNDRGVFGTQHNYSAVQQPQTPHVVMQTYNIPEPISHMAVTQTRQGITSRQLLAVLAESGSVVGIPRQVIDPRRPVGRDATTQEQMEGLMRYAPTIDFDPKWYLNHARELLGIERVTTSPAVLESTSLVFAYGLDVFGTRVAPSFAFDVLGKDFNKGQMLATVLALAVGTGIVAPLVRRKMVNARWQFA